MIENKKEDKTSLKLTKIDQIGDDMYIVQQHFIDVTIILIMAHLITAYLYVIVPIVMQIQYTVNFTITTNMNVIDTFHALTDRLSSVFLHLNIVKFPIEEKEKLLNKLRNKNNTNSLK